MTLTPQTVMRFITADLSIADDGFHLSCWMSIVEFYASELICYPHEYTYLGESCNWTINCNRELTPKLIISIGEQADKICRETEARHLRRKIANRS